MTKWKEFEQLAETIFRELQPASVVKHDDHIPGAISGAVRQIDVSIRTDFGDVQTLVVVQAKDWKVPADVNAVGAFAAVIEDVAATKGILVCGGGFTASAGVYARNKGIALCNLHDAGSRHWNLDIQVPLLWVDLMPRVEFRMEAHFDGGDQMPQDQVGLPVLSADGGATRVLPLKTFEREWNSGALPRALNAMHTVTSTDPLSVLVERHDDRVWIPAEFQLRYRVLRRAWLGYFAPSECRAIVDNLADDSVEISHLPIREVPTQRDDRWVEIDDPDELAASIRGSLVTSEGYEVVTGSGTVGPISLTRLHD